MHCYIRYYVCHKSAKRYPTMLFLASLLPDGEVLLLMGDFSMHESVFFDREIAVVKLDIR